MMTDRDKAIKGLERCCVDNCTEGSKCPYYSEKDCLTTLLYDALELLKAKYKPRESRKLLPCKCGYNRREHWHSGSYDNSEGLECMKCGFKVWGKNATDVIRKWNEAVTQNDEA